MVQKEILSSVMGAVLATFVVPATALADNPVIYQSELSSSTYPHMAKGLYATLGLGFSTPQPTSGHEPTHYGYSIYGHVYKATGFSGETGGGYDFGPARAEITYAYTNNALNTSKASASGITEEAGLTGSMTAQTILISAYYDLYNRSHFAPYIGGGIGYGNIGQSKVTFKLPYGTGVSDPAHKGVLAYRAKLGITYLASKKFDLFAEGVYQGSGAYSGSGGFAPGVCDIGPSNDFGAKAGIRYHFL